MLLLTLCLVPIIIINQGHCGTVSPTNKTVTATIGNDVILNWEVTLNGDTDSLQLKVKNASSGILWSLGDGGNTDLATSLFGENRFGVVVTSAKPKIVTLTLKNASLSDSGMVFELAGLFLLGSTVTPFKKNEIKLIVEEIEQSTGSPPIVSGDPGSEGSDTGLIVGVVIGVLLLLAIVIAVIYYLKCRKTYNHQDQKRNNSEGGFEYHKNESKEVSHYQKPEINVTNDRGQPEGASGNSPAPAKYDELGTGGGRPGPRDHTSPSNYAQAKQEDDYSAGEQSEYSDNDNEDNLVSDSIIV